MRGRLLVAAILLLAIGVALLLFPRMGRLRPGEGEGPRERPPPTGEISVAYPEEPLSLNPYLFEGDSNATSDLLRPVLPTLLAIGPDLRYRPALATRVPNGEDLGSRPFSVTYHLDRRARWSDGTAVTAADVRFTWETIRDPSWQISDRAPYERLSDVVAADPRTVRLVFDAPYPAWRDLFSAGDFILPKHLLQGQDFAAQWKEAVPVSAGPYTLEGWTRGLEVTYAANPRWWGAGPRTQRVRVFFVPSIDTALKLLEAGRVQVIAWTTQINLEKRIERAGGKAQARFGSAWWELGFDTKQPATREAVHRQAVAFGFDRAGIVEALIRREGRGLEHLFPGRRLAPAFASYTHDLERSKELRRQAGGIGTLAFSAPAGNDLALVVQRAVQVGLRDAGITAEVRNPEPDRFYGEWIPQGRFDLALTERRGTPALSLRSRFHSSLAPPNGSNYARLASPEVDAAVDAAERTASYRASLLDAAMERLAGALPALPMFESRAYLGFRPGIEGPDPNATVDGPFWNLEEWAPP